MIHPLSKLLDTQNPGSFCLEFFGSLPTPIWPWRPHRGLIFEGNNYQTPQGFPPRKRGPQGRGGAEAGSRAEPHRGCPKRRQIGDKQLNKQQTKSTKSQGGERGEGGGRPICWHQKRRGSHFAGERASHGGDGPHRSRQSVLGTGGVSREEIPTSFEAKISALIPSKTGEEVTSDPFWERGQPPDHPVQLAWPGVTSKGVSPNTNMTWVTSTPTPIWHQRMLPMDGIHMSQNHWKIRFA